MKKKRTKKEEKDPKEIIEFTFSPTLISQLQDVVDEFEFRLNYDEAKAEGMSYTTDQDGLVHIKITRERKQSKLDVMEEKLYDYASRAYSHLNDYLENKVKYSKNLNKNITI